VDDFFDNWVVQVRKGVLEHGILRALAERERYGYELVREMAAVPGLSISEGTLYPLMSRLRLNGLVKSRLEESGSGPARKYYSLTPEGVKTLAAMDEFLKNLNRSARRPGSEGSV
jgi:PadR family transcriptional regulator PadR